MFDASQEGGPPDLWIVDVASKRIVRLTAAAQAEVHPYWSPVGREIAYKSGGKIWAISLESGEARQLTRGDAFDMHTCWSPEGSTIAFTSDRRGNLDIWTVSAAEVCQETIEKRRPVCRLARPPVQRDR